jgi:hypothetical protein
MVGKISSSNSVYCDRKFVYSAIFSANGISKYDDFMDQAGLHSSAIYTQLRVVRHTPFEPQSSKAF